MSLSRSEFMVAQVLCQIAAIIMILGGIYGVKQFVILSQPHDHALIITLSHFLVGLVLVKLTWKSSLEAYGREIESSSDR